MHDLTVDDLLEPELVFQIGVEPSRIDILSSIDGVERLKEQDPPD